MFLFLILAFAQPYISQKSVHQKSRLIVYFDNSYSLQTKEKNITTFKLAIQELLHFNPTSNISLLTNNNEYIDLTLQQFRAQISKLKFSAQPFDLNQALLKILNVTNNNKSNNTCYILSDFQKFITKPNQINFDKNINYNLVKLGNEKNANQYIDSVYITDKNATNWLLNVIVKNTGNNLINIPISLYNSSLLIAKSVIPKFKNHLAMVHFSIKKSVNFNGRISLNNPYLTFDNDFYFKLNPPKQIRILNIGKSSKTLQKLFYTNEFLLNQKSLQNLDYTKLKSEQLIILNEISNISFTLKKALKLFINGGGTLVIIPNTEISTGIYADLLKFLNQNVKITKHKDKQLITKINYNNPLFSGVFEKPVKNFDYPSVQSYINIISSNKNSIIKFDNDDDFISQFNLKTGHLYVFASSIDQPKNTFKNSPLIVPVFYNIAKQSAGANRLYYTINNQNSIKIETHVNYDKVLKLKKGNERFIPQQRILANNVIIETQEQPNKQGIYEVLKDTTVIQKLAFNFNRHESLQNFYTKSDLLKNNPEINYFTNLDSAFKSYKLKNHLFELWKICIALSLIFYFVELLLLKHFKK